MQNLNFTRSILMGEFTISCKSLKSHLQLGDEIRLFEKEKLSETFFRKNFLFFVNHGKMASIISRPDKSKFRFLTMTKGTVFFANSMSPYTKYSQNFCLSALENTVLVAFDRECILKLLKEDISFASEYLDFSVNYHTIMQKRILLTANLSSSRRVLTWLFALCETQNSKFSKYIIPCNLNQQEIADILILHISTCNKIFAWLEKQGIATKSKEEISVNFPLLKQCIVENWKIY